MQLLIGWQSNGKEAAKTRSNCALFIGLRLIFVVLGVASSVVAVYHLRRCLRSVDMGNNWDAERVKVAHYRNAHLGIKRHFSRTTDRPCLAELPDRQHGSSPENGLLPSWRRYNRNANSRRHE
jgi:hypothetical protein